MSLEGAEIFRLGTELGIEETVRRRVLIEILDRAADLLVFLLST